MSRPTSDVPELSAIVVAYESGLDLRACLDSVRLEARRERITAELLVVDNASRDGCADHLEDDGVIVLRNPSNRGFGAAVNQGFRHARGRRVLLLNPDARLTEGSLRPLLAELDRDPSVAIAAPTLRLPDGGLQDSPRRFYDLPAVLAQRTDWVRTAGGKRARARHVMEELDRGSPVDVDWVTGAAMMLDRDAMAAAGPFDERYFVYFEDVDLCRRLAASGRKVRFVPDAVVDHAFQRASRRHVPWNPLLWQHIRSGLLYASRWSAAWWSGRWWRAGLSRALRAAGRAAILGGVAVGLAQVAEVAIVTPLVAVAACLGMFALPTRVPPVVGRAPRPSLVRSVAGLAVAGLASVGLGALLGLAPPAGLALAAIGIWAAVASVALEVGGRLTAALATWLRGKGLFHRAVLVAGPAPDALAVVEALRETPSDGLEVLGFVPLDPLERGGPTPRLRAWEHVVAAADDLRADAVLLTGPPEALARMAGGVVALREAGVSAAFVLSGASELLQEDAAPTLAGMPVMMLGAGPEARALSAAKLLVERGVALGLLVVLSPLLSILAVLSAAAFRAAPMVRVARVGLAGQAFGMWRLRSGPGAPGDEGGGRPGDVLRALHLDELPQLANVLAGEMSVVGPRPVTEQVYEQLEGWQRARCAVRPGITGMWQLDRLRRWRLGQMITSDLLYLLRWSPGLDVRIVARTLLGRRG